MVRSSDHGGEALVPSQEDPQTKRRETYQKLIRDYLRCATTIDENIGIILKYLDTNHLSDNTMVIYTSDQGYFLGEHNYFDKRFMLEESMRIPFVARLPHRIPAGVKVDPMILNVDFAPMLLDYAGQATPASMQGRIFSLLLRAAWSSEEPLFITAIGKTALVGPPITGSGPKRPNSSTMMG